MFSKISRIFTEKLEQIFVFFIAFLAIFSAIIYFFYRLNLFAIILAIILSIFSLIILKKVLLPNTKTAETLEPPLIKTNKSLRFELVIFISYLILISAALRELIISRSDLSLLSPWEVVDSRFFLFYLLSSALLLALLLRSRLKKGIKLFLLSGHYFIGLAIAAIVYRLGYGFDPFIHRAAMETIAQQGIIYPKTPYYLGQYGLIVSFNKILGLSIEFLSRWLVPVLAAWLLPKALLDFWQLPQASEETVVETNAEINAEKKSLINETKTSKISIETLSTNNCCQGGSSKTNNLPWLATLLILACSWPLFIMTTPQNLSYIFVLLAVYYGLINKQPWPTIIFSLATTAIHPLAGLPALTWAAWITSEYCLKNLSPRLYRRAKILIFLSGSLLLPTALFAASGGQIKNIRLDADAVGQIIREIFSFGLAGREDWLLNFVYFLEKNQAAIFLIFIISGLIYYFRFLAKKIAVDPAPWQGLLVINLSLIIAFFLSSQVAFFQLIAYEQTDYAKRIIILIALFSSPFLALGLWQLIKFIAQGQSRTGKLIWLLLALWFLTASLYLSYPRFDKYHNSRGYSTGLWDLAAVELISQQAQGDYIVLANQQVSAAALKTFGFTNYRPSATGEIYFYPIPTGGELYRYYLKMVYEEPSRETITAAMDLATVNEAYLVINKYWHESGKIIQSAKLSADSWQELGNKHVFIFRYLR